VIHNCAGKCALVSNFAERFDTAIFINSLPRVF
jgi:hypothetical protein